MSVEENKARIRRILNEALSEGNLAAANDLFDAGYIEPLWPSEWPTGLPGLELLVTLIRSAFPDFLP